MGICEVIQNRIETASVSMDAVSDFFHGFRGIACLFFAGAAVIVCILLFVLKRRNIKNFIFVIVIALICIFGVLMTDLQSTESFYTEAQTGADMSVSLSVRCDAIKENESEFIPEDGCILAEKTYSVSSGATVYDVLVLASRETGIHIEFSGTGGNNSAAYAQGINHLYEFDYGELSGWIYLVNGKQPSVGCGAYELKDGDKIEWRYTTDLGRGAGDGFADSLDGAETEAENETS